MEAAGGNVSRGIATMAVAVFIFTMVDVAAKQIGILGYDPGQTVFLRYLFGLIPALLVIYFTRGAGLRTKRPFAHILRGLLMAAALFFFFWALALMPLAEAIAVAFSAPLFITALSWPILGERVGPHRWGAVGVGFVGMLIIVQPGSDTFQSAAFLVIVSAFVFALAVLYTRRIAATETNTAIFTYTTVVAFVAFAPMAALTWQTPQVSELWLFAVLGFVGGAAHFLVIVAYRLVPAAINATFEYTALVWGSLWGWLIWQEKPEVEVWIGAPIIIAAGLYITYRETRRQVPVVPVAAQKRR